MTTYLPVISAVVVAIITFVGNYYVGKLKTNIDARTLSSTASDALRDDLLQVIDRYEKREQFLIERIDRNEKQNEDLQAVVAQLRQEIVALRIENQSLKSELVRTRKELELFERKVYYIPPKDNEVKEQ